MDKWDHEDQEGIVEGLQVIHSLPRPSAPAAPVAYIRPNGHLFKGAVPGVGATGRGAARDPLREEICRYVNSEAEQVFTYEACLVVGHAASRLEDVNVTMCVRSKELRDDGYGAHFRVSWYDALRSSECAMTALPHATLLQWMGVLYPFQHGLHSVPVDHCCLRCTWRQREGSWKMPTLQD